MFYENSNLAFKIINVFVVERQGSEKLAETKRNHTSLAYRIKGKCEFNCNSNVSVASEESVTYIPAQTDYIRTSSAETIIVVHLNVFGNTSNEIEIIPYCKESEPFFRKLLNVWESKTLDSYNQSICILYEIFEHLQNANSNRLTSVPEIIKPGVALLHKAYKNASLRISDLAEECFISEVYFRKIFHSYYGKSPQQIIRELRFQRAGELLESGYYTQKEAATLAGFSDVKYFRTAFKKYYKSTPGEYLKKCKGR